MVPDKGGALLRFGAASAVIALGLVIASVRFPGGFDWAYTVISKLASNNQNPEGGRWLAGSLLIAGGLLWPVVSYLQRAFSPGGRRAGLSIGALRLGLVGAFLLGLEGVFGLELSRRWDKAHEAVALVTFVALYVGILGLCVRRIRDSVVFLLPVLLVMLPLVAVGITQLVLYFDQRDLGWVNTDWREIGVPIWLSFAFWQWLAVAFLAVGVGALIAMAPAGRSRMEGTSESGSGAGLPDDVKQEQGRGLHGRKQ